MGKRQKKRKKAAKVVKKERVPVGEWLAANRAMFRPLASAACVLTLVIVSIIGLERVKEHVYAKPEFTVSLEKELDAPPEWVVRDEWESRILESVTLPKGEMSLHTPIADLVHDQLLASGWVSKVNRVSVGLDGKVRIDCDYRRPIAMLRFENENIGAGGVMDGFVAVDADFVRLPEVYTHVEGDSGWMRILGVATPLPEIGQPFQGNDALAGIRLAAVLDQQSFGRRFNLINVRNFTGRHDPYATHIVLRTHDNIEFKWGSAIGDEVEENTWEDKLRLIAKELQRASPQTSVDVSAYRNAVIVDTLNLGVPAGESYRSMRAPQNLARR